MTHVSLPSTISSQLYIGFDPAMLASRFLVYTAKDQLVWHVRGVRRGVFTVYMVPRNCTVYEIYPGDDIIQMYLFPRLENKILVIAQSKRANGS